MYFILGSILLVLLFFFYLIRRFTYWNRKGIPQKSFIEQWTDTIRMFLQLQPQPEINCKLYSDFPDRRYNGIYQLCFPVLLIRDPDLIKQITIKDFDHFQDHTEFIPEDSDPLWGKTLFFLRGEKWRDMRTTLSPSFTSSKIKAMFPLINECAQKFVAHFTKPKTEHIIDMKDAFTRFANDVIASTSFGITCNSLEEPNNEFYLMGKEATKLHGFWRSISFSILIMAPKLAQVLGIRVISLRVNKYFTNIVKSNMESREKNGIIRPDMIHLLMEAKKGQLKHEDKDNTLDASFALIDESSVGKEERRHKLQLTNEDLTAQAMIFFFAGFDSVSNLFSFLTLELAVNPDVQEILRKEVDETSRTCGDSITYDSILKMKYMDMVVSEGLRKWPNGIGVDRACVKPYTIQPAKEDELPVRLEKGTVLWLPIYAIHRNPQFYPNPDRFDPERFNDENIDSIKPYTYIPFGAGPRSCIANRFALLETKIVLFHILYNFEIKVTEQTTIPIKPAKRLFHLAPAGGFLLQLKPRNV